MRFGGSLRDARRAHGDGHEGRRSAAAVLVLVLLAAGCGGEGSGTPSDSVAKAAASATPGSTRAVTADVDGRKLSGHCAGTQPEGSPAIVFESGSGAGQHQLADIEQRFTDRTLVCAYDRAGVGGSDPPAKTPRPVSELVADLDAFLAAADAHPPYLLVGQSMGGNIVLMYAQAHPEKVAGFVSMNPVPPAETWLKAIRKVVSKRDFATERSYFHRGEGADNPEHTSFVEPTLTRPLPARMPYTIVFAHDCAGDSMCARILAAETRTTRSLAAVGDRGRFLHVTGADHDIFADKPEVVEKTIKDVLDDTH